MKSIGGNDRSFQRSSALDSHGTDGSGDGIFLHGVEITAIHRRRKTEPICRIDQGLVRPGRIARGDLGPVEDVESRQAGVAAVLVIGNHDGGMLVAVGGAEADFYHLPLPQSDAVLVFHLSRRGPESMGAALIIAASSSVWRKAPMG